MFVDLFGSDFAPGTPIIICTLNQAPSGTPNQQVCSPSLPFSAGNSQLLVNLSGGSPLSRQAKTYSLFRACSQGFMPVLMVLPMWSVFIPSLTTLFAHCLSLEKADR
jgi:hypothetical protein